MTQKPKIEPLVSIIIPAYNVALFIEETLDSVLAQDYPHWEAIIVDDASTDQTLAILQTYQQHDSRFTVIKNDKNLGAALTRNKAINKAKGRFLAFLDADDVWTQNKLSTQLTFMRDYHHPFTCTAYGKMDEQSNRLKLIVTPKKTIKYHQIFTHVPGNLTVMYDTEQIPKTTIPDIKKRNDLLMWARVIKHAETLYGLNQVLGYHRIRSGSISSNKKQLIQYNWRVYREFEKLSRIRALIIITIVIVKSITATIQLKCHKMFSK